MSVNFYDYSGDDRRSRRFRKWFLIALVPVLGYALSVFLQIALHKFAPPYDVRGTMWTSTNDNSFTLVLDANGHASEGPEMKGSWDQRGNLIKVDLWNVKYEMLHRRTGERYRIESSQDLYLNGDRLESFTLLFPKLYSTEYTKR